MKILLISPCPENNQRRNSMAIPQLTLSLIAAMTPEEHEVEIIEEVNNETIDFDVDVDIVGITLMTQTAIRGYEIANEFKKRDKVVIFGGIHATVMPHEAIRYADAVVIGEAEKGLWNQILKDIKSHSLKEFYKLEKFPDLCDYIIPRRDLINTKAGKFGISPIETGRGCPYGCDFCTVPSSFGKKQRFKSIDLIIKDIESITDKVLFFLDDNIALNKKYAKELFTRMIPYNKYWVGQASINIVKDKELMKLAYKSGCRGLLIGFESMTEKGIGQYKKTFSSFNENVEAIKTLQQNGIMTMASFVFGLDIDDKQVFENTWNFIKRAKPAFLQACVLTPYPGTEVFNRMKQENRILTDDWRQFDAKKVIVSPKNMSPEELQYGYTSIKDQTYSYQSIFSRAIPHIFSGLTEAALYFSLNGGARKWHKTGLTAEIFRNKPEKAVDFDVSKYVEPIKQKITSKTYVR
ncbi:B12-binding domain-containing radical SAM protein [Saccharicrinis sp. FJH62]|uniref:B12-binding domain-containing radical SAM protein n=1 Tax=Saccharicrinis sp. FJH62 TaxID=3344657 RepID=UPI0035D4E1C6